MHSFWQRQSARMQQAAAAVTRWQRQTFKCDAHTHTATNTHTPASAWHDRAMMFFWVQANGFFVHACVCMFVRVFGALVQVNKCKLTPTANVEVGEHDVDRKKFGCWKSWRTDWLYAYMRGYVCGQIWKQVCKLVLYSDVVIERWKRSTWKRSRTKWCCLLIKWVHLHFSLYLYACGRGRARMCGCELIAFCVDFWTLWQWF